MNRLLAIYGQKDALGLCFHLVTVWLLLGLSLFLLSQTGSNFGATTVDGPRAASWTPSGAFIGAVWLGLYTLMGIALWALNGSTTQNLYGLGRWVVWCLFLFCLVWPFYAFDTASRWPGLLGNLGILIIAVAGVFILWRVSKPAALAIIPTAVWISIATAAILDGAREYGW